MIYRMNNFGLSSDLQDEPFWVQRSREYWRLKGCCFSLQDACRFCFQIAYWSDFKKKFCISPKQVLFLKTCHFPSQKGCVSHIWNACSLSSWKHIPFIFRNASCFWLQKAMSFFVSGCMPFSIAQTQQLPCRRVWHSGFINPKLLWPQNTNS